MARKGLPGGSQPASTILSKDEFQALQLISVQQGIPKSELLRKAWTFYQRFYPAMKALAAEHHID